MSKLNGAYYQNTNFSKSYKKTINLRKHHYMHIEDSMFKVTSDNGKIKLIGELNGTIYMKGICN